MRKLTTLTAVLVVLLVAGCRRSPEVLKQEALERGKQQLAAKDYARAVLEFKNAVQAAPRDPESHYQLARAFIGMKDIRSAVAELRKATELRPDFAEAQIALSEVLSSARDPEIIKDAVQRMETVLSASPQNADALSTLAIAEFRLGDREEAEKHLNEAVESAPTNLKATVALAQLKISQQKLQEAEAILKRATSQDPPAATSFIVLGGFYLGSRRLADAKREFLRALELDATNGTALMFLGSLQLSSGEISEAEKTYKRLSSLPDKQYRSMYAAYLFQIGKSDDAIEELKRLTAADPRDRQMRRQLVSAYLKVGKVSEAEQMLSGVLKQNPKDTDALLQRSSILLSRGKYTEASNDINQVINYEPNSAQAHYLLSRVHEQRGNVNSRRDELTQAVRLNPEFLAARLQLAKLLLPTNVKSALDVINQTPDHQKGDVAVIAQRNWILLAMGNVQDVEKRLGEVLPTAKTPEILLQEAVLKLNKRQFDPARLTLGEVLRMAPEDIRAVDLLAQSYAMQGQTAAGVAKIRQHAAAHPKSARLQQHLGLWLGQTGATADARAAFQSARSMDNAFWPASVSLAMMDIAENKTNDAIGLLKPLLSHPQAGLQARALLASAEDKAGNHSAAIEHYRKLLEMQADNVLALNNLAYALVEHSNSSDEALKLAERAKELAPDNPTVDDTLGWVLYRRGLHSRAVVYLENSVKRQPNATRHAHLALAYAAKGDTERGYEQLQAAMKLNPASPEVAMARKVLGGTR